MPLGQVVDQHSPPLEPQHAFVALVDEAVVVDGRNLGDKAASLRPLPTTPTTRSSGMLLLLLLLAAFLLSVCIFRTTTTVSASVDGLRVHPYHVLP